MKKDKRNQTGRKPKQQLNKNGIPIQGQRPSRRRQAELARLEGKSYE